MKFLKHFIAVLITLLFIMLYKLFRKNELLKSDHTSESYWASPMRFCHVWGLTKVLFRALKEVKELFPHQR